MAAKDALGNPLEEKTLVRINLDGPQMIGRIKAIRTGGMVIKGNKHGQDQVTAGVVTVVMEQDVPFDPRTGICPALLALVDPYPKDEESTDDSGRRLIT